MKRILLSLIPVIVLLVAFLPLSLVQAERKENNGISHIDIFWFDKIVEGHGEPNQIQLYYGSQHRVIFFSWIDDKTNYSFTIAAYWNNRTQDWEFSGIWGGSIKDPLDSVRLYLLEILEDYQRKNSPQLSDPNKPAPLSI